VTGPDDSQLGRKYISRRRRQLLSGVEALEPKSLMAFTPLGTSIPDLAVSSVFAGPVAAYGGQVAVTIDVANLGAASMVEPENLAPGDPGNTASSPTTANIYLTRTARAKPGTGELIGTVDIGSIPQNRLARFTTTVSMPTTRPARFPDSGSNVYLNVFIDKNRTVQDYDRANNFTKRGVPVFLTPNLPQLQSTALELPDGLSPGDAVIPELKVANFGSAPTNLQVPVVVQVVASLDKDFGPGDQVLATFTVANINPLALSPTKRLILGDVNLTDPPNVVALTSGTAVTLPSSPSSYYVGIVVDPLNQIREIDELDSLPSPRLEQLRLVMPTGVDLPPAGVDSNPNDPTNFFPNPPVFSTTTTTSASQVIGNTADASLLATTTPRKRNFSRLILAQLPASVQGSIAARK
jgi:hypothetical protein